MHALPEPAQTTTAQFLVQHDFVTEVAAHAAVVRRHVRAQQPHRAGLPPNLFADVLLFAPFGVVGDHFGLHETRCSVAEYRKLVIHPWGHVRLRDRRVHLRLRLHGCGLRGNAVAFGRFDDPGRICPALLLGILTSLSSSFFLFLRVTIIRLSQLESPRSSLWF